MAPIIDPFKFRDSVEDLFDDGDDPFQPSQPAETANTGAVEVGEEESFNRFAREAGLSTTDELRESTSTAEAMLIQAGVDVDAPEVQVILSSYGDMLTDPEIGPAMIANLAADHPAVPQQDYDLALQQSGFEGAFMPQVDPAGMAALTSGGAPQIAQFKATTPNFEEHPETGWTRFQNGVLVSPDGEVAMDPTSSAPGSIKWQRDVVSKWGESKVLEWRKRLHEFGYLSKDQTKVGEVDQVMLNALQAYHFARYANGGKPVAGDLSGVAGAGAEKPKLTNFEDMSSQIRNDVREQYERVMGVRPTDGQAQAWADYIIRTGMDLQRKYRSKEYGNFVGMAATEAEERFIERLEGSPQATFLRESEEENTTLHDALQQAVIVTNSLGG